MLKIVKAAVNIKGYKTKMAINMLKLHFNVIIANFIFPKWRIL